MDALKHTHLLGRHLVIQWAQQGDGVDVDALREKVGRDVRGMEGFDKAEAGGKVVGNKGKRKFELGGGREEDDGLEG
jgi:multiple RNA-binding domain-containing protein 1